MITRYVNTASAAGGDGTTNGTAGSTRAFHSLAEALSNSAVVSAGALTDHVVINCSGTTADDGTGGGLSTDHTAWQFTTTATNYLEVFGDNTTGKWNTSAYRIEVTNRSGIYNQYAGHVRLYNLQIMVKSNDGGNHDTYRLSTANNGNGTAPVSPYFLFKGCIGRKDPTSTAGDRVDGWTNSICADGSQNGPLYVINCLAIGYTGGSSEAFLDDASAWMTNNAKHYNCTAAAGNFGYDLQGVVKNCLATGCTFGFISTGTGSDYNAEDDGNGVSGAHSHSGTLFTFVDAANGDYHLASADTGAQKRGVVDPESGLFSDDIDGQTRAGAWDIGADEVSFGGIAFMSSTGASIATSASTWSIATPSGLVGGGAFIVGLGPASSGVTISTITDNTTNVFLKAVACGTPKPAAGAELWYCNGISTSSTRISVTLSGASSGSLALLHATGLSTNSPLGLTGSSAITANSTSHGASSVTPTSSNGLLVTFFRLTASTLGTITGNASMTDVWVTTNAAGAPRTYGQFWLQSDATGSEGAFTTSSNAMHAGVIAWFADTVVSAGGAVFRPFVFTLMGVQ